MIEVKFSGELIAKFDDEESLNKWLSTIDLSAKKYLEIVRTDENV